MADILLALTERRLANMDKNKELKIRLEKDLDFRDWMAMEWSALYEDIMHQTNMYPGFYDTIEDTYLENR